MQVQGHDGNGNTPAQFHCTVLLLEVISHELEVFGLRRRMGVWGWRRSFFHVVLWVVVGEKRAIMTV